VIAQVQLLNATIVAQSLGDSGQIA